MRKRTVSSRTRILRATPMQVKVNKLRFWPEERAGLTAMKHLASSIRRGRNHNEKKKKAFRLLKRRIRLHLYRNKSRGKGLKSHNLPSITTWKANLWIAMRRIVWFQTVKVTTCRRRDLDKCLLPSNKNYNRSQWLKAKTLGRVKRLNHRLITRWTKPMPPQAKILSTGAR